MKLGSPLAHHAETLFHMADHQALRGDRTHAADRTRKDQSDDPVIKYLPYFRLQDGATESRFADGDAYVRDAGCNYDWDKPEYDAGALGVCAA